MAAQLEFTIAIDVKDNHINPVLNVEKPSERPAKLFPALKGFNKRPGNDNAGEYTQRQDANNHSRAP
jgi:hypothetical protein